ncbi:MAG: hypothetical protein C6Y20_16370 [Tagaea sp. CACIAM 22H2]|jgi:hypothetical protein|nr:hypothetical protein [Tagaea sp. CACIAM 22H2]
MSFDPQSVAAAAKALGIALSQEQADAAAKSLAAPLAKIASFRVDFDVEPAHYAAALDKGRAR